MILVIQCQSAMLSKILYFVKNILLIIMIISPILAIISLMILFTKSMKNPDDKKNTKKIVNAIKALIIIFMIPVFVNVVMAALGENTSISSCYKNASKTGIATTYMSDKDESTKTKINTYEKGYVKQLDFSCKSNIIHAQFSCDTIHIVENHFQDFTMSDYQSVLSSHGGIQGYMNDLGGYFAEYFEKPVKVNKAYEFQKIAEYVFGYMYIVGFDYYNGVGGMKLEDIKYCKWGGSCIQMEDYEKAKAEHREIELPTGAAYAFYPGQMMYLYHGTFPGTSFDSGIQGNNMTTNCNNSVDMVYTKANLLGTKERPYLSSEFQRMAADKKNKIVSDFKDLQIGDIIHFFQNGVDSSDPNTWSSWGHVAFIGEINYKTGVITAYDGGSGFTGNRNHKWTFNRNETTTSLHGYPGWGAVHLVDLT